MRRKGSSTAKGAIQFMKQGKTVLKSILKKVLGPVGWCEFLLKTKRIDMNTYYDMLSELVLQRVLTPTSVCIDVGCHVGSILKIMMNYAPQGRFLAFEPLPHLYEQLLSDFSFDNVSIYNVALSYSQGKTSFKYVTTNPALSGIRERDYGGRDEVITQIEVNTDTLDNILKSENIKQLSLIKIDVEGGEYWVMKGGQEYIKKYKPVIIFEYGLGSAYFYDVTAKDIFELLHDRCGLNISLMSRYLLNKPPFTKTEFCAQDYHFYYIAY
jgi:FkbM family methyltransferase